MKAKLAMFDLDGTLFDTRSLNYLAYKAALEKFNFKLEVSRIRHIPQKRMPRKVSKVDNKSVESMNQEYILVFKKQKG